MRSDKASVAIILGSAFDAMPAGFTLEALNISTPYGDVTLHRMPDTDPPAYVLFRHGLPHRLLPHQIPYRAHVWALKEIGCGALLVTSSVGVLDRGLPLFQPLLVSDLIMLDNRLPDGSTCTMFVEPSKTHGHMMITEGLFSPALRSQVTALAEAGEWSVAGDVVFGYVGGPRNKTPAENRMWAKLGAQVNSMSLGPEVVLANELEIPTAGLVVGHKYSIPGLESSHDNVSLAESLELAREAFGKLVVQFLQNARPVPFGNVLYRFGSE
ncbi:MAG: 5'-methylthioadenosine phosphorylase [Anaerolineales bacterium]|nr:5'-methylthioadenosine phosphorylase [Anaerolineales bacterium]